MSYKIFTLQELLRDPYVSENQIHEILADFFCSKNRDVEDFIRNKALIFEKQDIARTSLVFWVDESEVSELVAYYTVANHHFELHEKLSKSKMKKLRGHLQNNGPHISAILIGQLGKNDKATAQINGKDLFKEIFKTVKEVNKVSGGRFVYLECQDIPKLRKVYEQVGFELLELANGQPLKTKTNLIVYTLFIKNLLIILNDQEN